MSRYASLFTGDAGDEQLQDREEAKSYRLLIVDDEPNVLKALVRAFRQENYELVTTNDPLEALKQLQQGRFHLMMSDFKMPGMNGGDLLRRAKAVDPQMIRIMLTGHADTNAVMGAVREGAVYKFILKPWNDDDLRVTVALALEQYDLRQNNKVLRERNASREKEIATLSKLAVNNRSQLAIMLHKRGLLNDKQVQELYRLQQKNKEPTFKVLLKKEWVSEKTIRDILRKDFMIEEVSLAEFSIDPAVSALVPRHLCERHWILPLKQGKRRLTLVMADPLDQGLIEDLRFTTGLEIQAVMASISDIKDKISEIYQDDDISFEELETIVSGDDPYEGIEVVIDDEDDTTLEELLHGSDEPPAIRLVNAVILEAVRYGASDIHIHPRTKSVVVRYRIDGVLADKIHVPHNLHMSIVSRIKVMAELDITDRRRPQDGRITVKTPLRIVDLRISTLPTINGEKVVMRILDRNTAIKQIQELGFPERELENVLDVVSKPQGIILATGPTGSGKTTTLYSMIQHSATPEKNYVTIEDPVEYYMDMAGQVLIREKAGLDFATVLRAILRQDPDVILLGEIRDFETAEVAFHAALTGHLVYSTLHTNSSIATISRLLDLGLKPYVLATALEAIIAQRLVRRICEHCKEEAAPDKNQLSKLGTEFIDSISTFYHGKGCSKCNKSGYRGRAALYELLLMNDEIRHLIASNASIQQIDVAVNKSGFTTLLKDGRSKVAEGVTTIAEIMRILGPQRIA